LIIVRFAATNHQAPVRRSNVLRAIVSLTLFLSALCGCGENASAAVLTVEASADSVPGVSAQRLGVIVNDADPYSVATALYYVSRRGIPASNVIHVRIAFDRSAISSTEFESMRVQVAAQTPTNVQAYALSWVQPYRVDCMSITTAFAMGFDPSFCASGCALTRKSAYYNAHTRLPADSFGIFPTMSIAAPSIEQAKLLIDRGIASDGSHPVGTAYLVSSSDIARNVRAANYRAALNMRLDPIKAALVDLSTMHNRNDVMFYFVGAREVDHITSNRYLPGAVADHLTSTGGDLLHTRQMSSLRWIEAGVTGSYGAVVEPCAFAEKFPDPIVFMRFYLAGETLIEAYWKSVAMPGQGIFIGEPLARPFAIARNTAAHSEKQR